MQDGLPTQNLEGNFETSRVKKAGMKPVLQFQSGSAMPIQSEDLKGRYDMSILKWQEFADITSITEFLAWSVRSQWNPTDHVGHRIDDPAVMTDSREQIYCTASVAILFSSLYRSLSVLNTDAQRIAR